MTEKASTEQLDGVPETMLIPLYARAVETQRPDGIIRDPSAVEMVARINYDFARFEDAHGTLLGIAIRTEIFDEKTRAFIDQHPDALIINIAAGLDTRFTRVDNGQIAWVDLDLPLAMTFRRQFVEPDTRQTFIDADVFNFAWIDAVPRVDGQAVLIIIEGLLMYFEEAQVRQLLTTLTERLAPAEVLLEVTGVTMSKRTDRQEGVNKTSARFKWGLRHAETLAEWHANIVYVEDISYYDRYEARWLALPYDFPAPLQALRTTTNRVIHLRLNG